MNMLKRGNDFLTKKMRDSGSEVVEYITGNTRRTIRSTLAVTSYEVADDFGLVTKMEVRDFIILVDVLIGVPKRGDTIRYKEDVYEVMAINGTDVFKYSDIFKKNYRIHTKLVSK